MLRKYKKIVLSLGSAKVGSDFKLKTKTKQNEKRKTKNCRRIDRKTSIKIFDLIKNDGKMLWKPQRTVEIEWTQHENETFEIAKER